MSEDAAKTRKAEVEARLRAQSIMNGARARYRQDYGPGYNFVLEPHAEEYILEEMARAFAPLLRKAD